MSEANEISKAMKTGIRFVVRLGCELPESRVLTLHYEDLLPFNEVCVPAMLMLSQLSIYVTRCTAPLAS